MWGGDTNIQTIARGSCKFREARQEGLSLKVTFEERSAGDAGKMFPEEASRERKQEVQRPWGGRGSMITVCLYSVFRQPAFRICRLKTI